MDGEREPLDDLARAFREWPAPDATRELRDEDQATRRAVAWMVAALRAQAPASAAPPQSLRRRAPAPRPWQLRDWRPLAAAAVLLALLGGPLLLVEDIHDPPAPRVADASPPAAPPAGPGPATATSPGLVVAVDRERIELRSGPVRLLLLAKRQPDPSEEPR